MSVASVASPAVRPLPIPSRPATIPAPIFLTVPAVEARNEWIDVVRFFAAAGVVYVHAAETTASEKWGNLLRFAVPFYLFASMYFQSLSLRMHRERTMWQYILCRGKRLYLPFLAWSVIYLLARDAKHLFLGDFHAIDLQLAFLWKGTQYHLWFLPYLLAASVVLAVVQRTILHRHRELRWIAIAVMVGIGIWAGLTRAPALWNEHFDNPTYVYVEWWRSLPAMCWAIAFAWFMTMGAVIYSVPMFVGVAGIALMLACSFKQVISGIQTIPRGLTGLGCMLAALAPWRGRAMPALARYGRDAYGIYLCHVVFVSGMHYITASAGLPMSVMVDVITFIASFAGSIALVRLFSRSKYLAWLNG